MVSNPRRSLSGSRRPDAALRARAVSQKGQAGMLKNRWTLLAMGMAFSVALAWVVGQRLSGEAMAVGIGVMAGGGGRDPTNLVRGRVSAPVPGGPTTVE